MRIRVDWRVSLDLVGTTLSALSIPLAVPLGIAVYYGEPPWPFVSAILVTLILGVSFDLIGKKGDLTVRESFLAVSLIWFLIAVIGAIPFIMAGTGTIATPVNALFESMSGITTTGATVILDFDIHARSIMMWRQLIQWLGGLGILILATAILSEVGIGGAQLMEGETWTSTVTKLTPKIAETARILFKLYAVITAAVAAVLYGLYLSGLAPNMTLYNAVAHALTSVATAGFSPEAESAGAFAPIAQWVLIGGMLIGGTSFILIYRGFTEDVRRFYRNEEFRFYLATVSIATILVVVALRFDDSVSFGLEASVRHAVFNTVSILTTTGFASTDFNVWSPAAKHILFACMFLGAMVGSTTCSIKSLRWLVVVKAFRRELFTAINPAVVRPLRISSGPIDEPTVRDVYGFVLLSVLFVFGLTAFVAIDAARVGLTISEFEAMGAAASTFLNIGPAFGIAGPYGSYHAFPPTTKISMILLMWIGRVEIIPVLAILTRSFWTS